MIRIVTGGARSGKSTFAEDFYKYTLDVCYIATSIVRDEEMQDRVKMHREMRPSQWRTFEGYVDLDKAVDKELNYILDCLTVMTSNIMFERTKGMERISKEVQREIEDRVVFEIEKLIEKVREKNLKLVIVTNEVGYSIVPEHHISRVFRDIQGRVNQRVASMCDEAYLVALGCPVRLK